MKTSIKVLSRLHENRIPYISLSKDKEGKTGSATFLFIRPRIFNKKFLYNSTINIVSLIHEKKKISTKIVDVVFNQGKPFALKVIFLFPTKEKYFLFMQFLAVYSKQYELTYFNNFSI